MKKVFYFALASILMPVVSCGSSGKTDEEKSSVYKSDTLIVDSPTMTADSMPGETVVPESQVKEEAGPAKGNKKIDKLLKQCEANIHDIKLDGYEDGVPMDPAELQFSEVREWRRNLVLDVEKLKSMQSEMTDAQLTKFKDVEKRANKIFEDIDF